jgi:hypothetical protein
LRLTVLAAAAALLGCSDGGGAGTYVPITREQPQALLSAWIASDGTAYLAGGVVGGGDGVLLRWDGRNVTTIPTPGAHAFWWIHGVSDNEMYLAGESGEVHRFDGATLTQVDAGAPADAILFGIWGTSGDDLWAVGGSFVTGGPRQVILHLTGGSWTAVPSPASVDPDVSYFKVWGPSASQVWIVGDRGIVLRDDGGGAGPLPVAAPGAERYVTVHGCGPDDVWVVGGGAVGEAAHFDGASWTSLALVSVPPLAGVACEGGAGYAGGFTGYAARFERDAAVPIGMPRELQDLAIHGVAARGGRVLVVGGDLSAAASSPKRGFAAQLRR